MEAPPGWTSTHMHTHGPEAETVAAVSAPGPSLGALLWEEGPGQVPTFQRLTGSGDTRRICQVWAQYGPGDTQPLAPCLFPGDSKYNSTGSGRTPRGGLLRDGGRGEATGDHTGQAREGSCIV